MYRLFCSSIHFPAVCLAAIVLLCPYPIAHAASLGYDFISNDNAGGSAIGFIEFDDNVAPDGHTNNGALIPGITQFSWVVSGGSYDGLSVSLSNLTQVNYMFLSTDFANSFAFEFEQSNGGSILGGNTGPFQTIVVDFADVNNVARFTHSNFIETSAVPIPAAIFMFVPGLIGVFAFSKHRKVNPFATPVNQPYTNAASV